MLLVYSLSKLSKALQPSLNILLGYLLNGHDVIRDGKEAFSQIFEPLLSEH